MAALLLLRAPAWQHCCSRPCWTPGPSPGRGSRRAHRPSEGHSAQLLLQPPLYYLWGRPLCSMEAAAPFGSERSDASLRRWFCPFCGIRTSLWCGLGNRRVRSAVPQHKKLARARAHVCVCACCVFQKDCHKPSQRRPVSASLGSTRSLAASTHSGLASHWGNNRGKCEPPFPSPGQAAHHWHHCP